MPGMLRLIVTAAIGYAVARALLERELPESIPAPVRDRLLGARTRLTRARDLAREAIEAGTRASIDAERELMAEYHRRSGRTQ